MDEVLGFFFCIRKVVKCCDKGLLYLTGISLDITRIVLYNHTNWRDSSIGFLRKPLEFAGNELVYT